MAHTSKKTSFTLVFILTIIFTGLALLAAASDKAMFDNARIALFDRQWDHALTEFDRLLAQYPETSYRQQVLFYKGKCYEEKKMPKQALENYTTYLQHSKNESLKEQATISIIDMNFEQHQKTKRSRHLAGVVQYLQSSNPVVQYYAAIKLSFAPDKAMAARAVPVLTRMITDESDPELVDRAKIALMRINPKHLKKIPKTGNLGNRILMMQVTEKKTKRETFTLSIPYGLARLALDSLPDENKKDLEEKGYSLDGILNRVVNSGEILKIELEDSIFKVWIK